jgi:hypothetical protein
LVLALIATALVEIASAALANLMDSVVLFPKNEAPLLTDIGDVMETLLAADNVRLPVVSPDIVIEVVTVLPE